MKMNLSSWGLSNQRLVLLLIVILTLGGVKAFFQMPKLEDPEIVVRQAVVVGIYPGASAHQVELELTAPMENSIRKTEHILLECVRDQSQLKVTLIAAVCYVRIVNDVVRIKRRVLALRIHGEINGARDPYRRVVSGGAVCSDRCDRIINVGEPEFDFVCTDIRHFLFLLFCDDQISIICDHVEPFRIDV